MIEAHGRPCDFARSIIGRFARDSEQGNSTDAANAWQPLSAIVQSESAALELRSSGYSLADWDHVGYVVYLARFFHILRSQRCTCIDVEHRGTGPMGHARILSDIIVSNCSHSGSTDMSSLPRPIRTATSLPPLSGPAPSPTSRRCRSRLRLAQPLRTLAAASWRCRRDAATGLPLVLLHLRPRAPLGRYFLSGAFAVALDGAAV